MLLAWREERVILEHKFPPSRMKYGIRVSDYLI